MKKIIAFLLIAALAVGCLSGCQAGGHQDKSGSFHVVVTIYPAYDWVMNVLGDNPGNADVTWLLDSGVDLHSYQPSVADVVTISSCDLFIYVGGESDAWVTDALRQATNPNMVVVNLMDVLGDAALEEELVEGMQGEDEDEGEEEKPEYDEHVWLSLQNAAVCVSKIAEALSKVDAAHADAYKANANLYSDRLGALDEQYRQAVAAAPHKTVVFGDRFPFRYLTEDYGLSYYAAFVGCSAETEASFETILFLANKVDELGLPAVLTIEGANHRIAETVVSNTKEKNQAILVMDSLQSTTAEDVQSGVTYLSVMEKNLSVLKKALG